MAIKEKFSDFEKFIGHPVERYILPVFPANAAISPTSNITPEGGRGKLPGMRKANGTWVGFAKWTEYWKYASPTALRRFQAWQVQGEPQVVPICIATGWVIIAIDIDANNEVTARWFRRLADETMGVTPVVRRREGNETRMVLFYRHKDHTAPISKGAVDFVDGEGTKHLIEILGRGQEVVIEGPHKSGAMHYWESKSLIEGYDDLPEIDIHMCDALENALKADAESVGLTVVKGSVYASSNAAAYGINDLMSPNVEENRDRLTAALKHIDLDDERIDYHVFVTLLRATCAATMGDRQYMAEVVWPWSCGRGRVAVVLHTEDRPRRGPTHRRPRYRMARGALGQLPRQPVRGGKDIRMGRALRLRRSPDRCPGR